MVTHNVGPKASQVKILGTLRDDKSTFTTLLRGLGPLDDAPGRMTYDDSGPRPTERRGWPRGERTWTTASLARTRTRTSLEGASKGNFR
jgi:hypothetical protein